MYIYIYIYIYILAGQLGAACRTDVFGAAFDGAAGMICVKRDLISCQKRPMMVLPVNGWMHDVYVVYMYARACVCVCVCVCVSVCVCVWSRSLRDCLFKVLPECMLHTQR